VSLIIGGALQSVNGVCFRIDRKELTPELLFEVDWMGKMPVSASWQKRFLDHFAAHPSLKKVRVHKIFSSLQLNCSRARCRYNIQELKKARPELRSPEKSGGEGSFGLVRCLDGAVRTDEGELTGGEDVSIGGGATVRAGAVMS